jgi:hypothetical protein
MSYSRQIFSEIDFDGGDTPAFLSTPLLTEQTVQPRTASRKDTVEATCTVLTYGALEAVDASYAPLRLAGAAQR